MSPVRIEVIGDKGAEVWYSVDGVGQRGNLPLLLTVPYWTGVIVRENIRTGLFRSPRVLLLGGLGTGVDFSLTLAELTTRGEIEALHRQDLVNVGDIAELSKEWKDGRVPHKRIYRATKI